MSEKIKVVWICHFSTEVIRKCIKFTRRYSSCKISDFGIWNVNAIKQFEKYEDIELYVIFPHVGIKGRSQSFKYKGVNYICFKSEDNFLIPKILKRLFKRSTVNYIRNRSFISSVISKLNPNIIHIIGAEIPYYSLSALDIPSNIPSVVSLQTLMSAPNFFDNFPISLKEYNFRVSVEKKVISKATYIATTIEPFREEIKNSIKKDAAFLNMELALGVDIDDSYSDKEYDFVYFARNISKAGDYAIEAFALALTAHPGLTLNMSGSYQSEYKDELDRRINELGISNNVVFTGLQANHDEVIKQIKKSRFALLPLKVDYISTTIREAMACGLPVITTVTPGTPTLNSKRESVLLSEKGDFKAMADNMLKVVADDKYATQLRLNAFDTIKDYSNEAITSQWRRAYHAIVDNTNNGTPISSELLSY